MTPATRGQAVAEDLYDRGELHLGSCAGTFSDIRKCERSPLLPTSKGSKERTVRVIAWVFFIFSWYFGRSVFRWIGLRIQISKDELEIALTPKD